MKTPLIAGLNAHQAAPVSWGISSHMATSCGFIAGFFSTEFTATHQKRRGSKNILEICGSQDIGKAEEASVYLVFWPDWIQNIDEILNEKPDKCALVVYAPYNLPRIPEDQMVKLDGKRHTAVTQFRGRLLNDIVTSMITTHYEKS